MTIFPVYGDLAQFMTQQFKSTNEKIIYRIINSIDNYDSDSGRIEWS